MHEGLESRDQQVGDGFVDCQVSPCESLQIVKRELGVLFAQKELAAFDIDDSEGCIDAGDARQTGQG